MDVTDTGAAFSALHIIQAGRDFGIPIGHQFNPTVLARVLQTRCQSRPDVPFDIWHIRDGIVPEDSLRGLGKPTVMLIPLRLGATHFNPDYCALIKASLASPYSLGIIGGRSARAFYIVGYQDDSLLYLDPHLLQRTCTDMKEIVQSKQYHTRAVCELSWPQLDPTLLFGFLCRGPNEMEELIRCLKAVSVPMPVFSFVQSRISEGEGEAVVFEELELIDDSPVPRTNEPESCN